MSYQRFYHIVRDQQGNAINGASCTVYDATTNALALVYDPGSSDSSPSPLANPFVTTATGKFGFMAVDGVYDVHIEGGTLGSLDFRVGLGVGGGGSIGVTTTPVSVSALDAYSALTAYTVGRYVSYADQSWVCIQNGTGQTPAPGSAYWSLAYNYVPVATLTPGFTTTNQTSRVVLVVTVQPSVLDDTTIPLQDTIEVALCTTNTSGKGAVCARPGVTAAGTLPQTTASQQLADGTVYTVTFNADLTLTLNVAKPTTINRKVTVTYYTDPIQSLS